MEVTFHSTQCDQFKVDVLYKLTNQTRRLISDVWMIKSKLTHQTLVY